MNHGTRSCYVTHRCRCEPCAQANRDYAREQQRRQRRIAYGIEPPPPDHVIDATEVRDHIAWLRSQGIGLRTIATRAQIGRTALQQLATGESRSVYPDNAARILAVGVNAKPAATHIDAKHTWALIDDLLYLGFTKTRIAQELGMKTRALQINRHRITVRKARDIENAYQRLLRETADWHGLITGYNDRKCRCLRCRTIASERQREIRARRKEAA